MELVATVALREGMDVAEDVCDIRGNVIIKKDESLDKFIIQKIKLAGINVVSIKEPEDYCTTYFEKIRVSKTFAKFYEVYTENFVEYRKQMDNYLNNDVYPSPETLVQIVENIYAPFIHSKITILDMLCVLENSDTYFLYSHAINVALICRYTGKWFKLSDDDIKILVLCGFCYDIGKFKIPAEILKKQGKLTDKEYIRIKAHTLTGYQLISPLNIDPRIKLATLQHHERIDGSGYPQGLTDERINPFAKIIAILDSYEAMTSYRSYRAPLCPFKVIEIFEKDGYGKYDTAIYMIFLERMVEEYIGKQVQLSDGTIAQIVLINKQKFSRPMIKTAAGDYIDLTKSPSLSIENLV